MKTIFTLISFLFLGELYGQTAYKLDVQLERIPVNHHKSPSSEITKVLLVTEDKYLGIYTGLDTLVLEKVKQVSTVYVYIDKLHDDQQYSVMMVKDVGFILFVTPIKPYKRELWSLTIASL